MASDRAHRAAPASRIRLYYAFWHESGQFWEDWWDLKRRRVWRGFNGIMAEGESGRVVIARKSPRDIKMRDLYLSLDDEDERTMLFGESLEMAVEPGEHRIKATNRMFSRTLEFVVGPDETVRVNVANVPSWNPLFLVMLIVGTMPYKVWIERG